MDPLIGIAADVEPERVHALLLNRTPRILDPNDPDHALFTETVRGVVAEVAPLVGQDPPPGPTRDLAVWATVLGVAHHLEAALFPEQQLGEDSRAETLLRRYLGVLADLRSRGNGGGQSPIGRFPAAPGYPDPATYQAGYLL